MEDIKETRVISPPRGLGCGLCVYCAKTLRRLVPLDPWTEAKELCRIALPVFLSAFMIFMISVTSSVFCGHLGKIELDSVTLAIAVINVFGISIGAGLSSACDTLMSQTYGGKNMKRVGTILQRGILILMLFCFPCWAIFVNTQAVLLLLNQHPEVARLTEMYVLIFIPALPAVFLYQLQTRYLQNQVQVCTESKYIVRVPQTWMWFPVLVFYCQQIQEGVIWPQVITGAIVNVLNIAVNAIFMYALKWGVAGSAWANTCSQFTLSGMLLLYIWRRKLYVETWDGWSMACLQEWGPFIRLAIPSMLMICIEWWAFEIGGFLAGLLSTSHLGAQAIMLELATAAYMVPIGFSVAASVRVGNALGAGDVQLAKRSAYTALMCTVFWALVVGILVAALRNLVAYIFTNDKEIVSLVAQLMLIFAPFHFFDAISSATGGVLRGTGRQKIGAIMNAVGYYLIGFPIGISLMFGAKLGVLGLWSGLLICVFIQAVSFLILTLRMNWTKVAEEARVRAGVKRTVEDVNANPDAAAEPYVNYAFESDLEDATDLHSAVVLGQLPASQSGEQTLLEEDTPCSVTTVGAILPIKSLLFRRGLAVVAAILVLLIGLLIRFTLTPNG